MVEQKETYELLSHARQRVLERTSMTPEAVGEALAERGVLTRSAPGGDFDNVVFWSVEDREAFVAVVNRFTWEVLTVVPAINPDTDNRILLTDGRNPEDSEWTGYPRWRDLRYAIIRAENGWPDCMLTQRIEKKQQIAEELQMRARQPRLVVRLRVGMDDGRFYIVRGGSQARVESATEADAEQILPSLIGRMVKRLLDPDDGMDSDHVDSIVVEIVPVNRGSVCGAPYWERLLMAHGVPGPDCKNLIQQAARMVPYGRSCKRLDRGDVQADARTGARAEAV